MPNVVKLRKSKSAGRYTFLLAVPRHIAEELQLEPDQYFIAEVKGEDILYRSYTRGVPARRSRNDAR